MILFDTKNLFNFQLFKRATKSTFDSMFKTPYLLSEIDEIKSK